MSDPTSKEMVASVKLRDIRVELSFLRKKLTLKLLSETTKTPIPR